MKQKKYVQAAISSCIIVILLLSSVQAMQSTINKKSEKTFEDSGWYWKTPYPNYALQGLPDFDQKQDRWKKITAGPNGVIDSTIAGDDVFNVNENCIAPGQDCYLNSTATGDDVEEWVFCGPVAVADCFWWFDSKFADPTGIPGDGNDQFPLVQDYGAGDDHATNNVPLLVEHLARAMNTTQQGTTNITDMQSAITDWFNTTDLANKFQVHTYDTPTFDFTENTIEQDQNVILLLGSYDYVVGDKVVDQSQPNGPHNDLLQTMTWWDFQSFVPSVQRLDAIKILLVSNSPTPCDIKIDVYNTLYGQPLGFTILNPGYLPTPTWVQFDLNPSIPLVAGSTYYFDVLQLDSNFHYEWMYNSPDVYPPGQGWMNNVPNDPYGHPFDWAFQTEYYSPPPSSVRRDGHFVTCAGVNSEEEKIAISDPTLDVANTSQTDHNDAQNVSHDIYNVTIGTPQSDIETAWYLADYPSLYNYTVIEKEMVLCPLPDTTPPSATIVKPTNALYFLNNKLFNFPVPVMIGFIDVEVNASDNDSGIDRVEFYLDNQLKANVTTAPYIWEWSEQAFFVYTIKIIAYDKVGNQAQEELRVWKFL